MKRRPVVPWPRRCQSRPARWHEATRTRAPHATPWHASASCHAMARERLMTHHGTRAPHATPWRVSGSCKRPFNGFPWSTAGQMTRIVGGEATHLKMSPMSILKRVITRWPKNRNGIATCARLCGLVRWMDGGIERYGSEN